MTSPTCILLLRSDITQGVTVQCVLVVLLTRFFRGLLFGLSDGEAKEAVSTTCRAVVLHAGKTCTPAANSIHTVCPTQSALSDSFVCVAETRKTASGIIYTTKGGGVQQEAPPTEGGFNLTN